MARIRTDNNLSEIFVKEPIYSETDIKNHCISNG